MSTDDESDEGKNFGIDMGGNLLGGLSGLLGMVEKLAGAADRMSGAGVSPKTSQEDKEEPSAGTTESNGSASSSGSGGATQGSGRSSSRARRPSSSDGGGSFLENLAKIAERLDSLSEQGGTLRQEGSFDVPRGSGSAKGVYGFTIKTGLGESKDKVKVEPFGNIRKDSRTGSVVVDEVIEPQVDVFEDDDGTTLVAEMPGVGGPDILVEAHGDVITIAAENGKKKYRKELLLSHSVVQSAIAVTSNNGVVTIRCGKAVG